MHAIDRGATLPEVQATLGELGIDVAELGDEHDGCGWQHPKLPALLPLVGEGESRGRSLHARGGQHELANAPVGKLWLI